MPDQAINYIGHKTRLSMKILPKLTRSFFYRVFILWHIFEDQNTFVFIKISKCFIFFEVYFCLISNFLLSTTSHKMFTHYQFIQPHCWELASKSCKLSLCSNFLFLMIASRILKEASHGFMRKLSIFVVNCKQMT